jgi:diacylglycerol O-acyltransferase
VTALVSHPAWGQDPAMNAIETIMWRAESDPALKSTMLALEVLDRPPAWDDLVELHRRALERIPRLKQRVVEQPLPFAAPRWSVDPQFDLHFHLRRGRLHDDATWADLFVAVEQLVMTPFDRHRPPWEAVLVEGLPGGRAAYALKLHHASTDGLGTMQLMSVLHDAPSLSPDSDGTRPTSVVGRALGLARRVATDPTSAVRDGLGYGRSLQRVLAPPLVAPSPLLSGRSTNWRLAALDVDLDALRRAGKHAGGSVNDAYLAALLGGYRRYHEAFGARVDEIPMAIPVSVRRNGDPGGGNRFTSVRFSGPVGVVDPVARIAAIGALVRAARAEPAIDGLGVLAPVLAKLPPPVIAQVAGGMARGNDLQASNVPGASGPVFLAGARVERLYPYAPLPGCPAMITLVSHGPTCCVGVNYDPAAFAEGELFLASLEAGFAEVLAIVGAEGDARWVR